MAYLVKFILNIKFRRLKDKHFLKVLPSFVEKVAGLDANLEIIHYFPRTFSLLYLTNILNLHFVLPSPSEPSHYLNFFPFLDQFLRTLLHPSSPLPSQKKVVFSKVFCLLHIRNLKKYIIIRFTISLTFNAN